MTCGHCVQAVQKALAAVTGVKEAEVSLTEKKAVLRHSDTFDLAVAILAVKQEGYQAGLNP